MTKENYIELLKGLLPRGLAWTRELGTYFHKMLEAMAEEFARYDVRIGTDLINEADPSTTLELLSDWERVVGLPDPCSEEVSETVALRRSDVIRKLNARGGQSRQFFIDLAAGFGYTITISDILPFRSGRNRCGDRCYDKDWQFVWLVHSPTIISKYFLCGDGRCGDRLRVWRDVELECVINGKKPAHTRVFFTYGG